MNIKAYKSNPHKFSIFSKYFDKVSFERKNLPEVFLNREKFIPNNENGPKVSFQLAHNSLGNDIFKTIFDIDIVYTIHGVDSSTNEKKDYEVYTFKVLYTVLVKIENSSSIDELSIREILLIDVPHLVFPHIERFIFDFSRDSGSAPLQISPVDWMALFERDGSKIHHNMN
jgi:preprotein translocase subunit SecB